MESGSFFKVIMKVIMDILEKAALLKVIGIIVGCILLLLVISCFCMMLATGIGIVYYGWMATSF